MASNNNFQNKIVCVDYPGYVENVDKMLQTLGGINNIEEAVGKPFKKLELKFRPDNLTCKPTIADKDLNPGILLKVRVPEDESNKDPNSLNGDYKYDIEGITAVSFKFNRLCDFQYLPLITKDSIETKDSKLDYIYDKIVPSELPTLDWFMSEEMKNCPEFIVPYLFSKIDISQNKLYFPRSKFYESRFRKEYAEKIKVKEKHPVTTKYIPIPRRNKSYCKSASITDKQLPTEPYKSSLAAMSGLKSVSTEHFDLLKEMFEERPIWSRTACQHKLGLNTMQLRVLLPLVGYYFVTGPWRMMWVKYGYDPRTDPEARKYQCFDFRIRTSGGLKLGVESKRNYVRGETHSKRISLSADGIQPLKKAEVTENDYMLKPNMIPPARQMLYQYCDVEIPEIQVMLTRLPPVLPGTKCDLKNGWLPSSFTDQCREIANKYITEHVQALMDEQKYQDQKIVPSPSKSNITKLQMFEISDSEEESDSEIAGPSGINKILNQDSSDDEEEAPLDNVTMESVQEVNEMLGIKIKPESDDKK